MVRSSGAWPSPGAASRVPTARGRAAASTAWPAGSGAAGVTAGAVTTVSGTSLAIRQPAKARPMATATNKAAMPFNPLGDINFTSHQYLAKSLQGYLL